MIININHTMTLTQLNEEIEKARMFLQDQQNTKTINPDIISVMSAALSYVATELRPQHYNAVNDIFNFGVVSSQSIEHEKAFFTKTKQILKSYPDKTPAFYNHCLLLVIRGEETLKGKLEHDDPSHRNAINGIVTGTLALGILLSVIRRNPNYMILPLMAITLRSIPISHKQPSASMLGSLCVYGADPKLRQLANIINDVGLVNLGYRLFNFFGKNTKVESDTPQQFVDNIRRISSFHNPDYLEYSQRLFNPLDGRITPPPGWDLFVDSYHQPEIMDEDDEVYALRCGK